MYKKYTYCLCLLLGARMHSRVMRSVALVCMYIMYIFIYLSTKIGCLLPYCSKISRWVYSTIFPLSKNASSVFCVQWDWAIQIFLLKQHGPQALENCITVRMQGTCVLQCRFPLAHSLLHCNCTELSLQLSPLTYSAQCTQGSVEL